MKETEQTLLDQIKDQVANGWGYKDWKSIDYYQIDQNVEADGSPAKPYSADVIFEEVCNMYAEAKAQASCEATLKKAAENANVSGTHPSRGKEPYIGKSIYANHSGWDVVADKSSITDSNNIVIT